MLSRVLITGASGFVGPHLARALRERGAEVHGCGLGTPPPGTPLASYAQLDLSDESALRTTLALAQPTAIVHLAGQSSAAASFESPEATFQANVGGTRALLEAMRQVCPGARVVTAGTSEVYGPTAPGVRVNEDTEFAPVNPYGLSKAAADELAATYARDAGLDVVRARPFGHTGPGQQPRFMLPAFAQQIARIEQGECEPVLRVGNLDVTRDLSDVRDIVQGYIALIERGTTGRAYNLCHGKGVKLTDLVAQLVALARVKVIVEVDPARLRPADVPYLVGDPTRALAECGWQTRLPLAQTLVDVLAGWRASGGSLG